MRDKIKTWLTAIAGTVIAFMVADAAGLLKWEGVDIVPDKIMKIVGSAAIVLGILGKSPIGRLIFKDDPASIPTPGVAVANAEIVAVLPPAVVAAARVTAAETKAAGE